MESKLRLAEKIENYNKAFNEIKKRAEVIRVSKSTLNFIKIIEENMSIDTITSVVKEPE